MQTGIKKLNFRVDQMDIIKFIEFVMAAIDKKKFMNEENLSKAFKMIDTVISDNLIVEL